MIATSTRVDLSGVDASVLEKVSQPDYFTKEKKEQKKTEEAFFKQGEKPEVSLLFWPTIRIMELCCLGGH